VGWFDESLVDGPDSMDAGACRTSFHQVSTVECISPLRCREVLQVVASGAGMPTLPMCLLSPDSQFCNLPGQWASPSLLSHCLCLVSCCRWGQWASTRPDLFPPDLCRSLERLQTAAPAHGPAYSRAAVAASFNRPVTTLFDAFEVRLC
jgi:hypothetical protein